jgi:alkanesulfonate monooxygenase SsuD/methylene tetrahydromethanopterin reductase-like flavin-dependent oxidoreductase (luciferase family)
MMRFSLFSILDYYEDGSRTLSTLYTQLLDQIVSAERLGFDAYWIGEHHGYLTPHHTLACPNPAIVLTAAAQRTQRIGLNTAIANLSLRHPLFIAEDYALVDLLSQGRLGLGIGRGSYPHEYPAFGQSREESQGRFEESWAIIQQAWRGETVTFQGRYYQVDGIKLNVLPVQKPLPRYWFSVVREESFAALGRAAQPIITLPHLSADSLQGLAKLAQAYRLHYFAAGGDASQYELPLIFYTCVASTREEAQRQGREAMLQYLVHQHHGVDISHAQHKVQQLEERNQLWFGAPDDLIQWIEQHQASIDSRHFVFWLDFGGMPSASVHRSMHLLAEEVMPRFSALSCHILDNHEPIG